MCMVKTLIRLASLGLKGLVFIVFSHMQFLRLNHAHTYKLKNRQWSTNHTVCLQVSHNTCYQIYQHQQALPQCCGSWFACTEMN